MEKKEKKKKKNVLVEKLLVRRKSLIDGLPATSTCDESTKETINVLSRALVSMKVSHKVSHLELAVTLSDSKKDRTETSRNSEPEPRLHAILSPNRKLRFPRPSRETEPHVAEPGPILH